MNITKVYMAGGYLFHETIQKQIDELLMCCPHTITITFDWTRHDKNKLSQDNKYMVQEYNQQVSDKEIQGVLDADLVIVNITDAKYDFIGTFTELGIALGAKKRIWLICPFEFDPESVKAHRNVFYSSSLIEKRFTKWSDVLEMLKD
jgi:nucleoside 2-deoxyribosyltransferase